MNVKLLKWTPKAAGKMIGFCDCQVGGLKLYGVRLMSGPNGMWAAIPTKEYVTGDGTRKFQPVVEWETRDQSDRFSAGVIAAIRAEHPDALG